MKQLLAFEKNKPSAVFVSSDIQAIGAMQAIKEQGLHIPNDVAVIGFDDIELAQYVGLTTMKQPITEMGEIAVDRLISNIDHIPGPIFQQCFHPNLIVRESCGKRHQ